MDNNNSPTHTKRAFSSNVEENELWDLDSSWDEEEVKPTEEVTPAEQPSPATLIAAIPAQAQETAPVELTSEPTISTAFPAQTPDLLEKIAKPHTANIPTPNHNIAKPEPHPEKDTPETIPDAAQKSGLSIVEKIALSTLAIAFLGLAIWGYSFLRKQNKLADDTPELKFPIKGEYTTISSLDTFWKKNQDLPDTNSQAIAVPAVNISISESRSDSGAMRIYFRNSDKENVGDPLTIPINNGQFSNGEKSIEITATDGFSYEGAFNAHVIDRTLLWRVQILESATLNGRSDDFKKIIETIVEPIKK